MSRLSNMPPNAVAAAFQASLVKTLPDVINKYECALYDARNSERPNITKITYLQDGLDFLTEGEL